MPAPGQIATKYRTELAHRGLEAEIAGLAARQHGVLALTQLRAFGLSPSAVRGRVAAGRLHRVHRGVYALGHPLLSTHGRWMAAVLACGTDAVLSHRSAAALWGLRPTARTAIDVFSPRRSGRTLEGIDVHRATTLEASDVTCVDAVPCTTVARTLLDLASVLDHRSLHRAFERAEVLGALDLEAVDDLLGRSSGRPGTAALRAVVEEDRVPEFTRSELERRFLALCRRARLPRPRVNAWIALEDGGVECDFVWTDERLIVETDGHETHGTRSAFERDRVRDQLLLVAGWRVIRFTWRQIVREPDAVAATMTALLAGTPKRRGWDSNPRGS